MKYKITKQTTWTVEAIPVQKRKRSTGEQAPKQSVIKKVIQIINQRK